MKVEQAQWTPTQGWSGDLGPEGADLVLVFGAREPLEAGAVLEELAARQPGTPLVGCSTAGEILDSIDGDRRRATEFAKAATQAIVGRFRKQPVAAP